MAEEFTDEFDDGPQGAISRSWFDATEGERTLAALVKALRGRPESLGFVADVSRRHWPDELLQELEYCLTGVRDAAAAGHKFHLLIVS